MMAMATFADIRRHKNNIITHYILIFEMFEMNSIFNNKWTRIQSVVLVGTLRAGILNEFGIAMKEKWSLSRCWFVEKLNLSTWKWKSKLEYFKTACETQSEMEVFNLATMLRCVFLLLPFIKATCVRLVACCLLNSLLRYHCCGSVLFVYLIKMILLLG